MRRSSCTLAAGGPLDLAALAPCPAQPAATPDAPGSSMAAAAAPAAATAP
jgi:hypothetical protein